MKIKEIENLWEKDSVVDDSQLGLESTKTHGLHFKYSAILNSEESALKILQGELFVLIKEKNEYFNGDIDEEVLLKRNWLPFGMKLLKTKIPMYIDADDDIIRARYRIGMQERKIKFLQSIIDQIVRRSFFISNALADQKYKSGIV